MCSLSLPSQALPLCVPTWRLSRGFPQSGAAPMPLPAASSRDHPSRAPPCPGRGKMRQQKLRSPCPSLFSRLARRYPAPGRGAAQAEGFLGWGVGRGGSSKPSTAQGGRAGSAPAAAGLGSSPVLPGAGWAGNRQQVDWGFSATLRCSPHPAPKPHPSKGKRRGPTARSTAAEKARGWAGAVHYPFL